MQTLTPPLYFHLIWLGNPLRESEIASARALLIAAITRGLSVNFFVDNRSCRSVHDFISGILFNRLLNAHNIELPDLHRYITVINIDQDNYLQDFLNDPRLQPSLKTIFPTETTTEIRDFIRFIIDVERTGTGRNLAATSDLLRIIALL